jgi:hypothetical protein
MNRYGTFLTLLDRFKNHIFYERKTCAFNNGRQENFLYHLKAYTYPLKFLFRKLLFKIIVYEDVEVNAANIKILSLLITQSAIQINRNGSGTM